MFGTSIAVPSDIHFCSAIDIEIRLEIVLQNSIIIGRYSFNSIIPGIVRKNQKENVMKRTICLVVCALFMVTMMSGVAISAEKKAAEQEIVITGTIE